MVALGNANSRMKDFYDVWIFSNHLDFKANPLLDAINATFKNRETPVPAEEFEALSARFVEQHRVQWNAFVKKIGEDKLIGALGKVVEEIKAFAMPMLYSLTRAEKLTQQWRAGNGWIRSA